MERSQRELTPELNDLLAGTPPTGGEPCVQRATDVAPEGTSCPVEAPTNVVSLEARRKAVQANDDVEYLVAAIDPAERTPVARAPKSASDMPPALVVDDVLSTILAQLLGDARKERDTAQARIGRLEQRVQQLVALTKRWERHAEKTAEAARRDAALHAEVVDELAARYVANETRLQQAVQARDEAIDEMSQLVARTECNLIDALIARDAALALARELLADRWMRRWKREAFEARIDTIAAG